MFKFVVVFATCLTYVAAGLVQPTAFAAAPAAIGYANAPLYAAGGSQQIDVRHNYDGTLSSYTTTPFAYTSPVSSRYVAGAPVAYATPATYAAPAAYAAPAFSAPAAYASPSAIAATAKYIASAGFTTPFAISSPYAAGYGGRLDTAFTVPAKVVV